ncbi:hypothetical protein JTB14_028574 [Gonioctena quinquepunctata]|nr:hypothetical protein JTB14_028574 [Gonioctena quinquepunctata]
MRFLVILLAFSTYSLAGEIRNDGGFEISEQLVNVLSSKYENKLRLVSPAEIIANVDNFTDILFIKIREFAVFHGLDPVILSDIKENFLGSSVELTKGNLNGISTLNRYDNVLVKYKHDLKKLEIEFPIWFSDLAFHYHYHVILLLMGPEGNMNGSIQNFKANLVLSFDFNTYRAQIEQLKITNSGFIQLTFEGQGEIHNGKDFEISKELVDEFLSKYEKDLRLDGPGEIIANVDNFTDILFLNIRKFAISHRLKPLTLGDVKENFLASSVELTKGTLNGLSILKRYDNVTVKYKHDLKKLEIDLPIWFSDLHFYYHYHVILLLMGPEGNMMGLIPNFKVHLKLSFDFNTNRAQLEQVKVTNSGFIELFFEGGILDEVSEILSQFVTVILHPILIGIIERNIKTVANTIVTDVNTFIDGMLHPHTPNITVTFTETFIKNYFIL